MGIVQSNRRRRRNFDPAEHNVADLVAYAEAHPEQAAALLAAEAAGKARKTALDGLQAVADQAAEAATEPVDEGTGPEGTGTPQDPETDPDGSGDPEG